MEMNKNLIGWQSQDVESLFISVDGNICLALETDSRNLIEEAHHFIRFRRSYARSLIRKIFKKRMVDQRSSGKAVQKCGGLTFNHDSTLDESLVVAAHEDMNKILLEGKARTSNAITI
jgi:hypothetical protein